MKLPILLREAGLCPKMFPNCVDIDIRIFDEKGRKHESEDIHFAQKLFEDNGESLENFFEAISRIDTDPDYFNIDVQITENHVILFYGSDDELPFRRKPNLDPIDYMD